MSRNPSPVPDTTSPDDSTEQLPPSKNPEPVRDSSEVSSEKSEVARDLDSKSPSDNSTSGSNSGSATSTASTAEPSTPSASTSAHNSLAASAFPSGASTQGFWQAVWSPAHNAYYFYNSVTHETTWVNPLQSNDENAEPGPSHVIGAASSSSTDPSQPQSVSSSTEYDLYAVAAAQGIDPALAHLDPSLAAPGSTPGAFTYTAKFNARTGTFTRPDGRDPTHLSEYERAKRMSEFYFDVNAWEKEVEQRKLEEAQEEESRKRKRPTKKDLERFREQKKQKKLAKTAWLRT